VLGQGALVERDHDVFHVGDGAGIVVVRRRVECGGDGAADLRNADGFPLLEGARAQIDAERKDRAQEVAELFDNFVTVDLQ